MEWGLIWSQGLSTAAVNSFKTTEHTVDSDVVQMVQMTYENLLLSTQSLQSETSVLFALGITIENNWVCDFEETIEATRWFVSNDRRCIPTIPMSTHLFVRLNQLAPQAICIRPLWLNMGINVLNRTCLEWIIDHSGVPIWIADVDMSEGERTWLHERGFQLVGELT